MGRRSRKRSPTPARVAGPPPDARSPAAAAPPRRAPAALRRRARAAERPPAPWGAFPLGELTTLAGIVLLAVGFATDSFRTLAVGLALVALSATELALREHLAGFRSHSSLLALVSGAAVAAALVAAGAPRPVQLGGAAVALAGVFLALRRTFRRRTGGLGFRA